MPKYGRLLIVLISIITVLLLTRLGLSHLPPDTREDGLNIGIPDDAGALMVQYLIAEEGLTLKQENLSAYPLKDCCTTTSQWALSTDQVDMAVMCPDAAQSLINSDQRYAIIGPCLANSDIAVVKPGIKPKRIGVALHRSYQERLARQLFGSDCQIEPILGSALPYAYTKGEVDAVIIDVTRASAIKGQYLPTRIKGVDTITYVLVAKKNLLKDPSYAKAMRQWQNSSAGLDKKQALEKVLQYNSRSVDPKKEAELWMSFHITIMSPWR